MIVELISTKNRQEKTWIKMKLILRDRYLRLGTIGYSDSLYMHIYIHFFVLEQGCTVVWLILFGMLSVFSLNFESSTMNILQLRNLADCRALDLRNGIVVERQHWDCGIMTVWSLFSSYVLQCKVILLHHLKILVMQIL